MPKLRRCNRLAVSRRDEVVAPSRSTATQHRGYTVSIGREIGSGSYRRARTCNYQMLGSSSGSTRRFRVRSALLRWRLCSMLQRLLPQPLPLSLRWIISYAERLVDESDGRFCSHVFWRDFEKEFPPTTLEIKRSHAIHEQRIVVAAAGPAERSPGVAQPFNKSDALFFHIRSNA